MHLSLVEGSIHAECFAWPILRVLRGSRLWSGIVFLAIEEWRGAHEGCGDWWKLGEVRWGLVLLRHVLGVGTVGR
jgi:hypothetical protein